MEPNNRVPEGVSIAVNHYLTPPQNQLLHHNTDVHMIIKATKYDGSYNIEIVDQFSTIESRYFKTNLLENNFLCFLTTGIFSLGARYFNTNIFQNRFINYLTAGIFGSVGGKAVCEHSAKKRVTITRKIAKCKGRCPHAKNGLSVYFNCEGRADKLEEIIRTRKEVVTGVFKDYPIDPFSSYTLQIMLGEQSGDEKIHFQNKITLKELCKVMSLYLF